MQAYFKIHIVHLNNMFVQIFTRELVSNSMLMAVLLSPSVIYCNKRTRTRHPVILHRSELTAGRGPYGLNVDNTYGMVIDTAVG